MNQISKMFQVSRGLGPRDENRLNFPPIRIFYRDHSKMTLPEQGSENSDFAVISFLNGHLYVYKRNSLS